MIGSFELNCVNAFFFIIESLSCYPVGILLLQE